MEQWFYTTVFNIRRFLYGAVLKGFHIYKNLFFLEDHTINNLLLS